MRFVVLRPTSVLCAQAPELFVFSHFSKKITFRPLDDLITILDLKIDAMSCGAELADAAAHVTI